MPAEWLLGVALCLAGAAFTNLGLTLQKLSFLRTDALPPSSQPSTVCCQPLWLIGFSIFLVGQVGGMIAMGFSSQSVVATLGSFSLVTNAVFAPLILGEQLTTALLVSIVIIIGGSVIVILSSNHDNQDYTLQELLGLFKRDLFVVYMGVLAIALVFCVWVMVREHQRHAQQQRLRQGEMESGETTPREEALQVVVSPSFPSSPRKPLLSPSESFSSAESEDGQTSPPSSSFAPPMLSSLTPTLTAAILSSVSVLLGKCTMQLIKTSVSGDNQFTSPVSFVISAVFITAAIASVHLLNTGLRRGTALFVVPFYYVSSTSLAIVGGLVYFEEFNRFSPTQMVVFFGGVGLTVLGVWISTRGQMEEEEREAEAEEEEAKMVEADEGEGQVKEEQKVQPLILPTRSSPASPSSRSSTIPSPRSFTPRHPAIQEEPDGGVVLPVTEAEEAEEEERESAKRRAWHQKRAVSEPRLSFMLPSPGKVDSSQYGTFVPAPSEGGVAVPPESPPTMMRPSARAGRTQSMSMAEPVNLALSVHHQHSQHQRGGRVGGSARRAYVPHYTFAFFSVLPSNPPSAKRKSRSVSAAASRHLSPQATPTRSTPTRRLQL